MEEVKIEDIHHDEDQTPIPEEYDLDKEIQFARDFYPEAIEGVDEADHPPPPDIWLDYGRELRLNWEHAKVEMMGMYENEKTPQEQKDVILAFLQCKLVAYVDLMCSIQTVIEKREKEEKEKEKKAEKELTIEFD